MISFSSRGSISGTADGHHCSRLCQADNFELKSKSENSRPMPISLPPTDSVRNSRELTGWLLATLLLLLGANFLRMALAWLLMKCYEFFIQQNPFKS